MATVGFSSPAVKLCTHRPFSSRLPAKFRIQSSAEAAPVTSTEENNSTAATPPPPSESPVGISKRSMISADNVQKALRGIAITDADHYGRLGIAKGTSYDQVNVAYKNKCEVLMNQGLGEDETSKELELLKESYAILSSEEERRLYDWSLARSEKPDRYVWPFEVDITQIPTQPGPPQEPEDEEPTKLLGYFFLAWVILSFALSVTLNR